ncbi:MAG: Mur ligase family protein [Sphingopyxis sp.]|nr:Mur ligase family protein [Sphingopyxis sp.]
MSRPLSPRLAALRAAIPDGESIVTGGVRRHILFVSATDGTKRAEVTTIVAPTIDDAWVRVADIANDGGWLRIDCVDAVERTQWKTLEARLKETKRGYFRLGISFDPNFDHAFLETELNANAMLYGGGREAAAVLNPRNFRRYAAQRYPSFDPDFSDDRTVWLFTTRGAFVGDDDMVHPITAQGLETGRRTVAALDPDILFGQIDRGSRYLASQVKADGRFHYGWHPCFDRAIPAYNSLRHASSTYAMLEALEVTGDADLRDAVDRAMTCLVTHLIRHESLPDGTRAAFLIDTGDEIKLGGNAVAILAIAKHVAISGNRSQIVQLEALAEGILHMQNAADGSFVHVLHHPSLEVKQARRTIYYDGEAAFALMRLHALTGDPRWLAAVERAFGHFIAAEHWQAHDHWLGYAANELTQRRPEQVYFRFGIYNVRDYLDFVRDRITTFPTLLELMTAAEKMIARLRADPVHRPLLADIDLPAFYDAMHHRARHLLNGHFWPELAMYFADPAKIVGSFFIRHHAFRVRIDDVEHYLSGLIAYRAYLLAAGAGNGRAHEQEPPGETHRHWSASDVQRATGGRWATPPGDDWTASGLTISAPQIHGGAMVAVRQTNDKVGVPRFQLASLAHPPAALIVAEAEERVDRPVPQLAVPHVGRAVLRLGGFARARMNGKIFAVTGSAGKTTVSAMLANALGAFGSVGETRANANLPHGIAWNLASIPWDTPNIVLELAIGRMAANAQLARPHVAIFTNISPAHLEYHSDLATIAARKARIFTGMAPGDIAILNRDMAEWERVHMAAKQCGLRIVHYGVSGGCDARLIGHDPATGEVRAELGGRAIAYRLAAPGTHMALNSLAVLAATSAAGYEIEPVLARLTVFRPLAGRGAEHRLQLGGREVVLIDDAYNANPGSMEAAFAALGARRDGTRKLAVLGEMLELGPDAAVYHSALAASIARYGICGAYAVGTLYDGFWDALPAERRCGRADSADGLQDMLLRELRDGDLLLVKGSHGSGMHHLVDWLVTEAGRQDAGIQSTSKIRHAG